MLVVGVVVVVVGVGVGVVGVGVGVGVAALGYRIAAAVPRVPSVAVLPLHMPAALLGAEASLVSISGLRRLRSAVGRAAVSGLRLANPGAVLIGRACWFRPWVHVVWCRLMLRRHMAYDSSVHELAGVYSLLRVVAAGAPGHGPVHLLLSSAASLGFSWDSDLCVWVRPGFPALCQVPCPFRFFRKAVWDAWRTKVAGDLSSPASFRGGRYLDFRGSLELLFSPERRIKGFCVVFCLGVFGMDFFSALSEEKSFFVVFVGDLMVMGICFGSVIPPLFMFVRVLSFMISCVLKGVLGPCVFFGMVGFLLLLVLVVLFLGLLRLTILLTLVSKELWALTLTVFVGTGLLLIVFLLI